jgi:DNA-binding transcriptional regulator YdaS (Cro superfamily)
MQITTHREELRQDVNWSVLRQSPAKLPRENRKVA